ncbi:MAG: substrate-binding domain-containing protein [Victivallales bacterium]
MINNRPIRNLKAYSGLEKDLRKSILGGKLSCSEPISTEITLSQTYGISRNTARKALQKLVDEGLLSKVHGRGTFIVPPEDRSPELVRLTKILVIIPGGKDNIYDRKLVSGIADYAYSHQCQFDVRREVATLSQLRSQYENLKFDGIVWERPNAENYPIIEALRDDGIPQITVSRQIEGVASIAFDCESGMRESVRFLRGIGHSEIMFYDLDYPAPIYSLRQNAFADELGKSGASPFRKHVFTVKPETLTNKHIRRAFAACPDTTALIFSSVLTKEFMEYFKTADIRIPEDLSVIIFGETDEFNMENRHPYSILVEPRRLIGTNAAEMIKILKGGGKVPKEQMLIHGELMIRQSCRTPKDSGVRINPDLPVRTRRQV